MSKDILNIDLDRLEVEWVRQPNLAYDYGVKLADARLLLDETKSAMELVEAELDAKVRANPTKYGLPEKPTEGGIKAVIQTRPRYKDALAEVQKQKHAVDVLGVMTNALEHKKRALENLVRLHGQSYFGDPNEKGLDEKTRRRMEKEGDRETFGKHRRLGKRRDDDDDEEDKR